MKTYQQILAEKKKWKMEASQFEVPGDYEEDANEFITKASAAHKAGKSHFTIGGKTYPVTVKKPIKTENSVMKAAAKRYPDLASKQQDESIEEDMYSADAKTGLDGKPHPKHRINFANSKKQKEDEKIKAQVDREEKRAKEKVDIEDKMAKRGMKESRAQKIISTSISRMRTQGNFASGQSRIPTPAERRAEMEKQKQMKKEEVEQIDVELNEALYKKGESLLSKISKRNEFGDPSDAAKKKVKNMQQKQIDREYISRADDKLRSGIRVKVEQKEIEEATPSGKQVKQAIGIARDKRYAGGNMTGATKVMDKINKGLAQHPAVKKELRKQNEEVDQKEYDYEGDMAKNQLARIMMHSKHFMEMLQDDTNLPEWVQSKITKAEDYISSAHDYMMGEMQNEEVDLEEAKSPINITRKDLDKLQKLSLENGKIFFKSLIKQAADSKTQKRPLRSDKAEYLMRSIDAKRTADQLLQLAWNMTLAGDDKGKSKYGRLSVISPKFPGQGYNKRFGISNEEVNIEEKMNLAKTDMGDVIKDFQKSDAPQFKGKSDEKKRQMAIAAKLGAEREAGMREENEITSFADFLKDESKSGVYRHKGTYGTSYNSDDDEAPKKPDVSKEKRGRGRPVGAKSGARQVGSATKKRTGVDYSGYPLHLPNKNK
jgi:hypothetical protein